jgi:hypothetical protein
MAFHDCPPRVSPPEPLPGLRPFLNEFPCHELADRIGRALGNEPPGSLEEFAGGGIVHRFVSHADDSVCRS